MIQTTPKVVVEGEKKEDIVEKTGEEKDVVEDEEEEKAERKLKLKKRRYSRSRNHTERRSSVLRKLRIGSHNGRKRVLNPTLRN